jgi:DNA polymerase III delta prime subunit
MTEAAAPTTPDLPRWLKEFSLGLASNPQVVVTGNVRDYHVVGSGKWTGTVEALYSALHKRGIRTAFVYDPVDGLSLKRMRTDDEQIKVALNSLPDEPARKRIIADFFSVAPGDEKRIPSAEARVYLPALMEFVANQALPAALLMDYANWLPAASDRGQTGSDASTEAPAALRKAATLCASVRSPLLSGSPDRLYYNPIVWIVRQQTELPPWLMSSPGMRIVSVELPGKDTRRFYSESILKDWGQYRDATPDEQHGAAESLTSLTEGFTLRQSVDILNLARDQSILSPTQVAQHLTDQLVTAQRAYRVGVVKSEWETRDLRKRVRGNDCVSALRQSVEGQERAVHKAAEIVQRAVLGLAGAESSGTNPHRPKGVLFLAGPTGVGKTLLAKAITRLVFNDDDRYARFDMSEYSQEHSEARLIGAPPGYVGYSAGGQLTEAVRQKPFSLLLFDEIEKAHPLILDKFLQILDEGRLTDGSGMTVNFSETIIVFTSNLGIIDVSRGPEGPIVSERIKYSDRFTIDGQEVMEFENLRTGIEEGVRNFFFRSIQRPELLNRIGQSNIVVFDFISPDTARSILARAVANVQSTVATKRNLDLTLNGDAWRGLLAAVLDERTLSMGGRGVNAAVEEALVNPLARALATELTDEGTLPGRTAHVADVVRDDSLGRWSIRLEWS